VVVTGRMSIDRVPVAADLVAYGNTAGLQVSVLQAEAAARQGLPDASAALVVGVLTAPRLVRCELVLPTRVSALKGQPGAGCAVPAARSTHRLLGEMVEAVPPAGNPVEGATLPVVLRITASRWVCWGSVVPAVEELAESGALTGPPARS